jgi:adenosylcobinamide kinase/adenosylcobinamide-phosphate guanylyltransferase
MPRREGKAISDTISDPVDASAASVRVTLVLGGARSGKSDFAESLIPGAGVYLATAQGNDEEMRARIAEHRTRRPQGWQTIEEPLDLVEALGRAEASGKPVLLDCLTLWLSNIMAAGRNVEDETDALTTRLRNVGGPLVMVSNEVGQGIVPQNAVAREFRDHAGRLNQAVAAVSERVFLVTAGLPARLK